MSRRRTSIALRSLLLFLALRAGANDSRAVEPAQLAAATIIVCNKSAAESLDLARFYAQQRGIARDHIVALDCPNSEEITRDEYDATIAEPLRAVFRERGWWKSHQRADGTESVDSSTVQFVAVMRGMPLKIHWVTSPYPGDHTGPGPINDQNAASVDSELSILALGSRQVSGVITNPYFKSFRSILDSRDFLLLLACRLDGPTSTVVRRMITDSIAAEKNGLWGRAYVDASNNHAPGGPLGDMWMHDVTTQLRRAGVPVVLDDLPGVFPAGYPMTNCALYYGWYVGEPAGPFADPNFRIMPGAIAVHIHSFSAGSLRDPKAGWVAPLLMHGAAASLGNVYEPYLQLTAQLDIFNDRLLHGMTFGESAYASVYALSWMSVMVGDPLYRPYLSWLQIEENRPANEWKFYHEFAAGNGGHDAPEYRAAARQAATRARNGPMLEDLAGMEARDGNFAAAVAIFDQARSTYPRKEDIIRVVIQECDALVKQDKRKRALDLVRSTLRVVSPSPSVPILKEIEHQLTTP
jgi:uncharacterized protein (TIGR03790 family)